MSKIISLNVFLEYNSFRYIISGNDNKGYKGRADRIMRFAYVKANALTFDSCRVQMESEINTYLKKQPVIKPFDFDQLDEDMNEFWEENKK